MDKDWGPKPFRSIDAWLMERGFCEMVKDKWNSYPVQGSAFIRLKEKLKYLKGDLKVWNKDVFGNIQTCKKRIVKEIEELDVQDCNGTLEENDRLKRIELVNKMRELDKKLDSLICQKARASWFKNGDSCTKFYHSSLRWRRLRNEVRGIEVGGNGARNRVRFALKRRSSLTIDLKPRKISMLDLMGSSLRLSLQVLVKILLLASLRKK